jgi:RNA polymerase sigma factor (sigma-70 family)
MEGIARESREQANSIEEVNAAVRQMDEMTQHNAALVEETNAAIEQTEAQAVELDAALRALELEDARAARVVELHYFAGLSLERVAELLGVARRTIARDWRYARAFLEAHIIA